ncbi:MAG TPA: hypothetical protein PLF40_31445 [Kofleriaceae bacterium]|nr:hypothetical protein [Kofleriaceae bacterium]
MALLTSALDTPFTPAKGPFNLQVGGTGSAVLERENVSGAGFVPAVRVYANTAVTVANDVAGARYKLTGAVGVTVHAYQ